MKKRWWRWPCLALALAAACAAGAGAAEAVVQDGEGRACIEETGWEEPTLSLYESGGIVEQDGVKYDVSGGTASVVGYTRQIAKDCVIPERLTADGVEYPVTAIADSGLYNCSQLVTITLPDTLERIGYNAFSGCTRLEEITIPAKVTVIGGTGEKYRLYRGAFQNCAALTAIHVAEGNTSYREEDGVLFDQKGTLIQYPIGRPSDLYSAPDGTSAIDHFAFYRARRLTSVVLPDSVVSIGRNAFEECVKLASIDLGQGLRTMDQEAFANCASLKKIALPASITGVKNNAFRDANALAVIEVDQGCANFLADEGVLFQNHNGTKRLLCYPPARAQTSYTVPEDVTAIEGDAFWDARNLVEINLPKGLTGIGDAAFTGCERLESITIPDTVQTLGAHTFQNCDVLSSVTLGAGVKTLEEGVFHSCASLTELTIPAQVDLIFPGAFEECGAIRAFTVAEGNTAYCALDGVLYSEDMTQLVAYPAGRGVTELTILSTVEEIDYGALGAVKTLERISVGEGNPYFYAAGGVLFLRGQTGDILHTYPAGRRETDYRVPEGVTEIGARAFYWNTRLESIDTNEVSVIGDRAFFYVKTLREVKLPSVAEIGDAALFQIGATSLSFPASLVSLGNQAFDYSRALEFVTFAGKTPPQCMHMLCDNCEALRYVYVPAGAQTAYKTAFSGILAPGAMIVEGVYVPEEKVEEQIGSLTVQSPVADINSAAAGVVRLTVEEAEKLSDEALLKADSLFQGAHSGLTVEAASTTASAAVSVQGAALASGLVERQGEDGAVVGSVAISARDAHPAPNELLCLELTMEVDGAPTQLQAPVLVSVKLPESMAGQPFHLEHRDDSGSSTKVPFTLENDSVSFRTRTFSSFAFVMDPPEGGGALVSYEAQAAARLFLAGYDGAGRMTSITVQDVEKGRENILFTPEAGLRYKAFVLDESPRPAGAAAVTAPRQ